MNGWLAFLIVLALAAAGRMAELIWARRLTRLAQTPAAAADPHHPIGANIAGTD